MPTKQKLELPVGTASNAIVFGKSQIIFRQGDAADTVFYIEQGRIKLTVGSKAGKEAVLCILSEGEFFGEGPLAGLSIRMECATAVTPCHLLRIDKQAMTLALHRETKFSDLFVAGLLMRKIQLESNLIDQLFNSSEKRLARVLLLLAQFGKEEMPEAVIHEISQETLAGMIGTTRSRVNFFMNRFRTSGFIDYGNDEIQVHRSLLNVVNGD